MNFHNTTIMRALPSLSSILAISVLGLCCINPTISAKPPTAIDIPVGGKINPTLKDSNRVNGDVLPLKFEPQWTFSDYKVETIDNISKAKLDFLSNQRSKYFRTVIKKAYKTNTSNFAGHYIFVEFGCGTSCSNGFFVDRQTGKIYDSPDATLGYEFHPNSRLLLINPPDEKGFYDDCFDCKPKAYLLDEKTKTLTELKSK